MTRDAVTVIRKTCRVRHMEVTTTDKLMVTETRIIQGETNKYEEMTHELKVTSMKYSYPPPWHILLSTYYYHGNGKMNKIRHL